MLADMAYLHIWRHNFLVMKHTPTNFCPLPAFLAWNMCEVAETKLHVYLVVSGSEVCQQSRSEPLRNPSSGEYHDMVSQNRISTVPPNHRISINRTAFLVASQMFFRRKPYLVNSVQHFLCYRIIDAVVPILDVLIS